MYFLADLTLLPNPSAKMAASDARLEDSGLENSERDVVGAFERLKDPALFEGALRTLRLIDPATVTQHLGAVVARLEDAHITVRYWALDMLHRLDPAALAQHADAIVAMLEDSGECVHGVHNVPDSVPRLAL